MFLSITGVTDDKKLTKYQPFEKEADAIAHAKEYNGFAIKDIGGNSDFWIVDKDKKTITQDTDTENSVNLKRAWAYLRQERDAKLAESDWMSFGDSPDMSDEWKAYRKALRDLPSTLNDTTVLKEITWPEEPS